MLMRSCLVLLVEMPEKYICKIGLGLDNLSEDLYSSQIPHPDYLTKLKFLEVLW